MPKTTATTEPKDKVRPALLKETNDRRVLRALNSLGPSSVKKLDINLPDFVTGSPKELDYKLRSLCRRGLVESEVGTMYGRKVRRYTLTEKGKEMIGVQSQKPVPKPAKPATLRRKAPEEKEDAPETMEELDIKAIARRFAQPLEEALVKDVQTVLRGASLRVVIEDSTGLKTGPQVSVGVSLAEFMKQMPAASRELIVKLGSIMGEEMLRRAKKT